MPEREPAQRVAIADDDVLLRQGLAALLREGGFDVVGQASDADGLIELVGSEQPDLAIVDIRMPPTHTTEGLEAARTIREELPQIAILVLSAHIEVEHAMDLLGGGQRHRLSAEERASTDVDELVRHARPDRARAGPSSTRRSSQELVAARRARDPLEALTAREREVLALMAEGRSNAGIARSLWIAEGTVEKHVRNIFPKLRLPDAPDDHRRVLAVIAFLGSKLAAHVVMRQADGERRAAARRAGDRDRPAERLDAIGEAEDAGAAAGIDAADAVVANLERQDAVVVRRRSARRRSLARALRRS